MKPCSKPPRLTHPCLGGARAKQQVHQRAVGLGVHSVSACSRGFFEMVRHDIDPPLHELFQSALFEPVKCNIALVMQACNAMLTSQVMNYLLLTLLKRWPVTATITL